MPSFYFEDGSVYFRGQLVHAKSDSCNDPSAQSWAHSVVFVICVLPLRLHTLFIFRRRVLIHLKWCFTSQVPVSEATALAAVLASSTVSQLPWKLQVLFLVLFDFCLCLLCVSCRLISLFKSIIPLLSVVEPPYTIYMGKDKYESKIVSVAVQCLYVCLYYYLL